MWFIELMNKILYKLFLRVVDLIDQNNKEKIIKFFKARIGNNLIHVIDIGAHKGETIDLFMKNFNIKKIYSFEPNNDLFTALINKNYDTNIVNLVKLGVGKISEKKILKIFKDSSSSTLNTINENTEYFKRKKKIISFFLPGDNFLKRKQEIDVINLSEFFNQENITKIDILKIDTEGYEFHAINGIYKLDFEKIKFIYFEHHYDLMIDKKYKFSDINDLLKKNDFHMRYKLRMKYRKSFEYIYENSK